MGITIPVLGLTQYFFGFVVFTYISNKPISKFSHKSILQIIQNTNNQKKKKTHFKNHKRCTKNWKFESELWSSISVVPWKPRSYRSYWTVAKSTRSASSARLCNNNNYYFCSWKKKKKRKKRKQLETQKTKARIWKQKKNKFSTL